MWYMEQHCFLNCLQHLQVYDIRKECIGPLCYDFSRLDDYINQPHVRKELGVGDREWEACNMDVNFDMQGGSSDMAKEAWPVASHVLALHTPGSICQHLSVFKGH